MPRLKLDFHEPLQGEIPFDPHAYVALSWSTTDKDGPIHITPQCNTPLEIDSWINTLQTELEEVRKAAHKRFAKSPYFLENRRRKANKE